jgi:hypothetical protein
VAAALAAGLALGLATGCGGSDDDGDARPAKQRGEAAPEATATADAAFEQHSAEQVADHFEQVTGDKLDVEPNDVTWDSLTLADEETEDTSGPRDRYGYFTIAVLHSPRSGEVFKTDDDRPIQPDGAGIYWTQDTDGWDAAKFYGNVVLSWSAESRATNEQFQRLDVVLSTLGQPAEQARAKLPATDQSCEARGMTLDGTAEGSCRDGDTTLTVVNRGTELELPEYSVKVVLTRRGTYVKPRDAYGTALVAKGAYVGVGLRLDNTGNTPVRGLYDAKLRIGDRYYDQDSTATFRLANPRTFPLQPGAKGGTLLVFDIPKPAARRALSEGAIVFPAEPNSSIEYAAKLGASRLRKGGEPAPGGADPTPA